MDRKLTVVENDYPYGVCVWRDEDGDILADADNNFLSIDGYCGDQKVEAKMEQAARYWMGASFSGSPAWISGARKISDDEFDDQNERLLVGKVADPYEEAILAAKKESQNAI